MQTRIGCISSALYGYVINHSDFFSEAVLPYVTQMVLHMMSTRRVIFKTERYAAMIIVLLFKACIAANHDRELVTVLNYCNEHPIQIRSKNISYVKMSTISTIYPTIDRIFASYPGWTNLVPRLWFMTHNRDTPLPDLTPTEAGIFISEWERLVRSYTENMNTNQIIHFVDREKL